MHFGEYELSPSLIGLSLLPSGHPKAFQRLPVETEQLAFPIRPEMGEEDDFVVYPEPDVKVLEKIRGNKTRTELWDNLPTELGYLTRE